MELWNTVLARRTLVLLGILATSVLYAVAHAFLDEYVTIIAGGGGAYAGYAYVQRGSSGELNDAQIDDAYAWGLGTLIGVLAMHTVVQGGLL
jgi:hypothetical protein